MSTKIFNYSFCLAFSPLIHLFILILALSLIGCQSGCLSVTGGYKDATGTITWCKDQASTQALQRPVLVDGGGERALIITESEMKKLNDKIDKVTPAFLSKKESVIEAFLEKLNK